MPAHLAFFLLTLSFLSGIVYASLGLSLLYSLVPAAILFAAVFVSGERLWLALLASALLLAGGFYYLEGDGGYRTQVANLPEEAEVSGNIVSDPAGSGGEQSFYLKTGYGKLLVRTGAEPEFFYGDKLVAVGAVSPPPDGYYGRYLGKERVAGTMQNPRLALTARGEGGKILSFLYRVKRGIRAAYRELLRPGEAALLSGVTLGVNQDFSEEFLQKLSLSGTRHLTAVSGLHIAIIVAAIMNTLLYVLTRRWAFVGTFVLVFGFVALIGFPASAIRAGIMGFLAALAKVAGRKYAAYNALALAALALALVNPKVLIYDVGFQLSFLAAMGIVYLEPVLRRALGLTGDGFLNWKATLLATLSAQAATAPILIVQFQNFSLTAFAANVLILTVIPVIMASGLLMGLAALVFYPVAQALSFLLAPLITYVILVISFFADRAALFNPKVGAYAVAAYYAALIGFTRWFYRKKTDKIQKA